MSQDRDGADQGSGRVPFDLAVALLDEAMSQGQAITLHPRGGSMYPVVRTGDRVIARQATPDETCVGDIILYRRQGWVVVHRVVGRRRVGPAWRLQTLGDATLALDAPLEAENLLGRVIRLEREGRVFHLDCRRWRWLGWGLAQYLRRAAWLYRAARRLGLRRRSLRRLHRLLTLPERGLFKALLYQPWAHHPGATGLVAGPGVGCGPS